MAMAKENGITPRKNKAGIKVTKHGPYLVKGKIPLRKEIVVVNDENIPLKWKQGEKYPDQETYALCRCGRSGDQPYCDGAHVKAGFDGTETAGHGNYIDMADKIPGPGMTLTDAEEYCSIALFCHRDLNVWNLTEKSDDPKAKETAIQEACDCPSGRLVAWNNETGKPIEPKFEPSISLVEEPYRKLSGPLWVKGGIPIESADGINYEVRNRVTLCRCGQSKNKPFCDGGHVEAGFKDGDKSVE
jgi:CDGSH-type Zn-finger protein